MKITIAKSILENILISSQPFLEKKDTSQITSHVYIKVQNSVLTLKATDYEIGLDVSVEQINSIEDGEVTANGKKLLDIIRILKDSDVTLETKNDILHISQASSNFKLPTFLSNEFPLFPNYEGKPKISIDSHTLIESLKKITPAIDSNNPKFELNGALIDIKNDSIAFVSTDTRRLALVNINNSTQNVLSIIIPKKAIIEIQKLFFDNIEIYYDNTYLIIRSDQYTFYTKLINGKFPDYSRIIPKEIAKNILLPKSIIIDSIKQITTISNDMKLTLHKDKIIFESLSNDNIEAKTEISHTTGFDEPFILAVNSRYILDFLAQINNQEFTLGLNDSNLPFVLTDDNFKTIVMPIVI
ncbi:DNA polymerase III subunit beta [Sulfurimonas sp. HSL-1716]|uniref:DNA polymerase III subunit beta n=1 Tax=Hydrocurvibacter sulfurireducens TaxID=3131937 RepID=UPI0031F8B245